MSNARAARRPNNLSRALDFLLQSHNHINNSIFDNINHYKDILYRLKIKFKFLYYPKMNLTYIYMSNSYNSYSKSQPLIYPFNMNLAVHTYVVDVISKRVASSNEYTTI